MKYHQFNSNREQQRQIHPRSDVSNMHLQPILSNVTAHPVSLVPLHSELIAPDNVDSSNKRKRRLVVKSMRDDVVDTVEEDDDVQEEDEDVDIEDEKEDDVDDVDDENDQGDGRVSKHIRPETKVGNKRVRAESISIEEELKENEHIPKKFKRNNSIIRTTKQKQHGLNGDSDRHHPFHSRRHQNHRANSRVVNTDDPQSEGSSRRNLHGHGNVIIGGELGQATTAPLRRRVTTTAIRHDDIQASQLPGQGNENVGINLVSHNPSNNNSNGLSSRQGRRADINGSNVGKNINSHHGSGNRSGAGGNTTSNGHGHSHHHQGKGRAVRRRDDRNGHLVYKLGEGLDANDEFPNGRYKILNELGEGTFGKVVECWDRLELRRVAIKVVRSDNKYRQAARLEIDILLHLNLNDANGVFHCVKLYSWFEYHSHVCMVFEKLGPSLYDQLRRNQFRPFPLEQVRDYAFQLLESVNFVHSLTLIHTDLKPENILIASIEDHPAHSNNHRNGGNTTNAVPTGTTLDGSTGTELGSLLATTNMSTRNVEKTPKQKRSISARNSGAGNTTTARDFGKNGDDGWNGNAIKLIDFGSATYEAHHHSALISTRHYRAPEVILGLGWTYPCDLWSIGCILVELYTGQALFQTHENLEHLAMMSHVLGPIPESMIRRTVGQGQKYFRNKGGRRSLNWPSGATSKSSIHSVRNVQSLDRLIPREIGHDEFRDLVKKLLAFEPHTRYTTREALRHPFFRNMGRGEGNTPWSPRSETVRALGWGEQHNNGGKVNGNGSSRRRHEESGGGGASSKSHGSGVGKSAAPAPIANATLHNVSKMDTEVPQRDRLDRKRRVPEKTQFNCDDMDEDEDLVEKEVRHVSVEAHRLKQKQKQKQKQEDVMRSASVKEDMPFCAFPVGKGRDGPMTQQVW